MKIITARYEDICLTCLEKIKPGDLIHWEKHASRHAKCAGGIVGKWLGAQR